MVDDCAIAMRLGQSDQFESRGSRPSSPCLAKGAVVVVVLALAMFGVVVPIFAQPAATRELGRNDASAVAVDESHDDDAGVAGIRL